MTAAEFMRHNRDIQETIGLVPTPAFGHIPFPGHHTIAQHWAHEERYKVANLRRMREYGFDPAAVHD